MVQIRLALTLAALALAVPAAQAACYVVYGPDQQVVYRAQQPPVDMSRPLHETLPQVAPGGSMVFSLDNFGCELTVNQLPLKLTAKAPARGARKARRKAGATAGGAS
ncbi:hypothetical protein [Comamonas sp. NLF-1-9]|uniref:hypothetical protein n=1 Tax=Comamonas sp. NLF-1-9 TaxID=2853163 RepID=UPI001C45A95B|nr:hypothetical protein [Comamonas sp. NLF-1-9]QXL84859.1 hypothetical protein KUD94_02365 [Comamonas sp. NLF-1-9]